MSAILSACELYRYRLSRTVAPVKAVPHVVAFFGVNPSTADAEVDDQTVRKWRGFSKRLGATSFVVGNLFAYRATDVLDLAVVHRAGISVIGEENDAHIDAIILDADVLVPCWGNRSKIPTVLRYRAHYVLNRLLESGKPVLHFGLTKSGDPKHPLTLGYDTPLSRWPR